MRIKGYSFNDLDTYEAAHCELTLTGKHKLLKNVFQKYLQPSIGVNNRWRSLYYCEDHQLFGN